MGQHKKSGKEQSITIQGSSGLSSDEVDNLVQEAEANEKEDARKLEVIEAQNKLDTEVYHVEKLLGENKDKLPAEEVESLEAVLSDAQSAKDSEDLEKINQASEQLMQAAQKLAQAAQAAGGGAPQGSATAEEQSEPSETSDDDVIDVEFEDAEQ